MGFRHFSKVVTLCHAGQTINPDKKFNTYSCAIFTGAIPSNMETLFMIYAGQIRAACCDTAANKNAKCVSDKGTGEWGPVKHDSGSDVVVVKGRHLRVN